ncbi:MAG TPA: SpoIID/LytB domain-containing protein [Candidatus Sulfopaludibacter sp.]|nr:SpoIID/LytB domain-containing protein [Candidatus Sulfopaludibacter sp.]
MWTLWHDREVVVTPTAATIIQTCERCAKHTLLQPATIRAGDRLGVTLEPGSQSEPTGTIRFSGGVTLRAHSESATVVDPVEITGRAGALIIKVTLPVERYVEQVVASESGPADSLESLKALAIVVRSYALHEAHGHSDYDLCDSTHCQLLHWHDNRRSPAAHRATLETSGETLWFRGRRALAYFAKDCGGRTASASEVWPRLQPAPYLPSRPDPYCSRNSAAWATELTRSELAAALTKYGLAAPGWQHLSVDRRGDSGRVLALRVNERVIGAEDFRIAVGESLGWSKIPSTWFEVSPQGDRFLFHGRGTGHGVGLCQQGASVMASQGHSAPEILAQFFPGADVADEAKGRTWQVFSRAGFTLETLNVEGAAFLPEIARARAEASQRSGLNGAASFTVRAFASTQAFRDATLAPGWTAAFTEGDWIASQPLATLASRRLLVPTIRHEFIHALVEQEAGQHAPLWLREGLAELWSSDPDAQTALHRRAPTTSIDAIDAVMMHAATEGQSSTAHRDAGIYAARLLDGYGRAQVLDWLRSGVPAGALAGIGQR